MDDQMKSPDPTDEPLEQAISSLKGVRAGLTGASRRHLALLCREDVQLRSKSWWQNGLALFPSREAAFASAALGLALCLGIYLIFSASRTPRGREDQPPRPVQLVSVALTESGGVTLTWRDGNQRVYNVLKSSDPRDFRRAERYAVRGHQWTDGTPSAGQVVFYKVE